MLEIELNKIRVQFLKEFMVAMENRLEKEYNMDWKLQYRLRRNAISTFDKLGTVESEWVGDVS